MSNNGTRQLEMTSPIVTALAIAAGTGCYADPVRFDNDGSFVWSDGISLDITKGVMKQTGQSAGQGSFTYMLYPEPGYAYAAKRVRGATSDDQLASTFVTLVRDHGAIVPNDFSAAGMAWERISRLGGYYQGGFWFYTYFSQTYPADNIPGPPEYIAARFDLADGTHYGWMSLSLTHLTGPGFPDWRFDLLAWGYETEPDTPLPAGAAPAPGGALAALAVGAAAGMTRGRRKLQERVRVQ